MFLACNIPICMEEDLNFKLNLHITLKMNFLQIANTYIPTFYFKEQSPNRAESINSPFWASMLLRSKWKLHWSLLLPLLSFLCDSFPVVPYFLLSFLSHIDSPSPVLMDHSSKKCFCLWICSTQMGCTVQNEGEVKPKLVTVIKQNFFSQFFSANSSFSSYDFL